MVLKGEDEYYADKLNELQQFIELNRSLVLDQFRHYKETVKGINILHLKIVNHQTTFKHEFNLGFLSPDQYQQKIEILNGKLGEQELIKSSITHQFITNVFGGASIVVLPSEIIISYLQQVFV